MRAERRGSGLSSSSGAGAGWLAASWSRRAAAQMTSPIGLGGVWTSGGVAAGDGSTEVAAEAWADETPEAARDETAEATPEAVIS